MSLLLGVPGAVGRAVPPLRLRPSDTGSVLDVVVNLLPEILGVLLIEIDGVFDSVGREADRLALGFQRGSIDVVIRLDDASACHADLNSRYLETD